MAQGLIRPYFASGGAVAFFILDVGRLLLSHCKALELSYQGAGEIAMLYHLASDHEEPGIRRQCSRPAFQDDQYVKDEMARLSMLEPSENSRPSAIHRN